MDSDLHLKAAMLSSNYQSSAALNPQAYLKSAGWDLKYVESYQRWMLSHQDGQGLPLEFRTAEEVSEWWNINAPLAFREAARARSLMRRTHSSHRAVRDTLKAWAFGADDEVLGQHAWTVAKAATHAAKIHPRRWRSDLVELSLGDFVHDIERIRFRRAVLAYIEQVERDELERGIPRSLKAKLRPP